MTTNPAFNPVLLDIPDRFETERLLVRAPRPGDGAVLNASINETLEDLRRFPASMPWAMEDRTEEKAEEFCRRSAANWILRADFSMLLFRRDTGEHAGNCGLHRRGEREELAGSRTARLRSRGNAQERALRPRWHEKGDALIRDDALA